MPTPSSARARLFRRLTLALLVITLAAAATTSCGGSTSTVATPPEPTAAPDDSAPDDSAPTGTDAEAPAESAGQADPDVVTFAETLELVDGTAAPTTQLIAAATGGSLSVTADDGTVFTLDIPADALAEDTTITASAVTVTGGITGVAATHAVRLEPDGLRFLVPAMLHVDAPTAIAAGHALAFTAGADGSDPLLAETIGGKPGALVDHFSIWGLLLVVKSISDVVVIRNTPTPEDDLFNRMSLHIAVRKSQEAAGLPTDETDAKLQEDMSEYLDTVVVPLTESSDGSCEGLRAVATKLINYYQIATRNKLVGVPTLAATVQGQVIAMDRKCEADAIAMCKEAHDPQILIRYWINVYTYKKAAGFELGTNIGRDVERARTICSAGYTVTGGGSEIVITGTIEDVAKPFLLEGSFTGGSAVFSYSPVDETTGSYTINGGGSGAVVTGSGAYVIEQGDGDTLTLTQNSSSCVTVSGACRDTTEVMTLTPK